MGTGYRYSPPGYPPGIPTQPSLIRTTPGTPPLPLPVGTALPYMPDGLNIAVGLISVAQLSLSARFSGSRELTEVYNLIEIGRINNHNDIPGNK